ncbi:hypothetical protein BC833DRAFT_611538 [Globomyces pollinis-pini]|nr:hypothetical protein BC833DRAFT_611538 [Globomyces pollinis-pini]
MAESQNADNDKDKFASHLANIFGDSDEDEGELPQDINFDDSDEDIPLPSFKRKDTPSSGAPQKSQKSTKRQRRQAPEPVEPGRDLTPEEAKRLEDSKYLDEIFNKPKAASRSRKAADLGDDVEVDAIIEALINAMREAAFTDQEFNKNGQPAIAKLKLLPSAMIQLSKTHWFPQFLELNVLECIKFWLEPLADGSLPSLDIQNAMMTTVSKMPIDTHHLRSSLIGRVVMFYTKCDRVNPVVKRQAEELIRRWMRPILGKSSNHKHREIQQKRYEAPRSNSRKEFSDLSTATNDVYEKANRASIPTRVASSYNVAPSSQLSNIQGTDKKSDKYRKLKSTMKMLGRK